MKDNSQDMMNKGRGNKAKGDRHGRVKVSTATVNEIKKLWQKRALYVPKLTQDRLAKHYRVGQATISRIVRNERS
jgi:hypothetical protein